MESLESEQQCSASDIVSACGDSLVDLVAHGSNLMSGLEKPSDSILQLTQACKFGVYSVLNKISYSLSTSLMNVPSPGFLNDKIVTDHVFLDDELDGEVEASIYSTMYVIGHRVAETLGVEFSVVEKELHCNSQVLAGVRVLKTFLNGFAYAASIEYSKDSFESVRDETANFLSNLGNVWHLTKSAYVDVVMKYLRNKGVFTGGVLFNSFLKDFVSFQIGSTYDSKEMPHHSASVIAGAVVWANQNYSFLYEKYGRDVSAVVSHMTEGEPTTLSGDQAVGSLTVIRSPDPSLIS